MPITTPKNGVLALSATNAVVALLQQGDTIRFSAEGNSMFPLIPSGSTVVARPFRPKDARLGSILLFPHGKRLVLHRLVCIEKQAGTALFRGDMNRQGHETVGLNSILGTAITVIRPDGKKRALATRAIRWKGLLRYHARPLRRWAARLAPLPRRAG